jgi:hypothetical protein
MMQFLTSWPVLMAVAMASRPAVRSFSAAGAGRVPLLLAIPNPPGEGALEDGRRFFHSPAFDDEPDQVDDPNEG